MSLSQSCQMITRDECHDKYEWGAGPWVTEPDWALWRDDKTGLLCLIKRNCEFSGSLLGYVEVPKSHQWHGKSYNDMDAEVEVHGGLTFSGRWPIKPPDQDWLAPVEEADPWFLGFDTNHYLDYPPMMEWNMKKLYSEEDWQHRRQIFSGQRYRDFEYVKGECESLARQIHQVRRSLPRRLLAALGVWE